MPEHWLTKKIKFNITKIYQGWSPQCESFPVVDGKSWAVVKVGCVNKGEFNPLQNKKLPDELEPQKKYTIMKGDVLISRANAKEWVGSAAVPQTDYPNLLLCDKIYCLKINRKKASPDFIAYFLSSGKVRKEIEIAATGTSSSMLNIGQNTILDMPISQPSLSEQIEIVNMIKQETKKISELISEVKNSIDLLKERRTALISAAVTGKIDVRDS